MLLQSLAPALTHLKQLVKLWLGMLEASMCHGSVFPPTQPIIIIITRPHLISPEPQSSAPAPHLILITSAFINTSTSTSSSSLVQTPLDSLTASLPSCCIDSVTNLLCHPQRVVLVLSPPHRLSVLQHSSRIPRGGSIHDLLELKDTTGLICSSPVEVSSYPLLTCFLLFTWLLSIKRH